jgi:pimeloyl-ACP methyl ester carboxylesterase
MRSPRKLLLSGLLVLAACTILGLAACTTPSRHAEETAAGLGLTRRLVPGAAFEHVVYQRGESRRGPELHVYLEGDASPRRALRSRPPDPTPSDPLMLRLMALDPAPSVYLGRPCQHGTAPCDPIHWSSGRFGEPVVASLVAALEEVRRETGASRVVLFGYSGGGALAMLVAERAPEVTAVVTLAGNLAVGSWANHHGHTPLEASLDPALRPPLRPEVLQLHVLGGRDEVVPPALTRPEIARQPGARTLWFPDQDHVCCWAEVWPRVLAELERELAPRRPRGLRPGAETAPRLYDEPAAAPGLGRAMTGERS